MDEDEEEIDDEVIKVIDFVFGKHSCYEGSNCHLTMDYDHFVPAALLLIKLQQKTCTNAWNSKAHYEMNEDDILKANLNSDILKYYI